MKNPIGRAAFAALVVSVACIASAVQAQSKDPVMGSWKLNAGKSKYNPGPPPKSIVTKFESAGKAIKNTTEFVAPDGKASTMVYSAEVDGKDYPLSGSATANSVSLKKLADGSVERTDKKDGKAVQTLTRTVSKDGKTLTVVQKGTTAKGAPLENVMVFDRQ